MLIVDQRTHITQFDLPLKSWIGLLIVAEFRVKRMYSSKPALCMFTLGNVRKYSKFIQSQATYNTMLQFFILTKTSPLDQSFLLSILPIGDYRLRVPSYTTLARLDSWVSPFRSTRDAQQTWLARTAHDHARRSNKTGCCMSLSLDQDTLYGKG